MLLKFQFCKQYKGAGVLKVVNKGATLTTKALKNFKNRPLAHPFSNLFFNFSINPTQSYSPFN